MRRFVVLEFDVLVTDVTQGRGDYASPLPVRATNADWSRLRAIVVIAGVGWALAFILVGLAFGLQMYGDGSFFSYSIAVQEAWAYHWHNISGRVFVYLASHAPAELYVRWTGDAAGGLIVYGLLHFASQLAGLAGTWFADASKNRLFFAYACLSTACLCPLVFGFPTEMWMSHALFWPTLAFCHCGRRGSAGGLAAFMGLFMLMLALILTHEGAVIYAGAIVATTGLHGLRDGRVARAAGALGAAMVVWAGVKWRFQPDPYLAEVLARNAVNFIDVSQLVSSILLLLVATLATYGLVFAALRGLQVRSAEYGAGLGVVAMLAIYWLGFDHSLHAESRYYFRTALLGGVPVLGALAAIYARAQSARGGLTSPLAERVLGLVDGLPGKVPPLALSGAVLLLSLVQVVETAKFVRAWTAYKAAVGALAMKPTPEPAYGDPAFVSSAQLGDDLNRLSWFSTTQYLSVLAAPGFAPARLVVDANARYFWITCETAQQTEQASKAIPVRSRGLVRKFACLHRRQAKPGTS